MYKKFISLSNLTLLVALSLSSVAAYYSIIGLTAIFAGAVIPVIVMGSILEVGKITTTVWLRKYWHRASWLIKLYLVPAVVALALLTSMGIFGFLSKAHMDQGVISGDAVAKVAIFDEKIKTAKDNIDANRKVLKQMDESVDQIMGRSTSETGADKAVAVRKSQQKERARIIAEIQAEQKTISQLSEERAPLAAEVRKVEAEVGPIKYIAALIYGDNADSNMLEAAVRWVIILLVAVFDPLAIALVLAANASKEWDKEDPEPVEEPKYEQDDGPLTVEQIEQIQESVKEPMKFVDLGEHPKDHDEKAVEEPIVEEQLPEPEPIVREPEPTIAELHPYLNEPFKHFEALAPIVYKPEPEVVKEKPKKKRKPKIKKIEPVVESIERPGDYVTPVEIETYGVTQEDHQGLKTIEGDDEYVLLDGRHMRKEVAKSLRPDLFRIRADDQISRSSFGSKFPELARKGDSFVRVDVLPNRVFKFDGTRWIEINKDISDSYLHNEEYIKYLLSMIESGNYDIELLSENERAQIEQYLSDQKN